MTFELHMLVWATLILFATIAVQGFLTPLNQGFAWGLGARDEPRDLSILQGRMRRAVSNGLEAMALFTPLVAATAIAGVSNGTTQLGSILFVAARALYPVVYGLGLPVVRTIIWSAGVVGIVLIAVALLSA
ncbi:MAG: MAPEG family protein [Paracoccaceae bacterium]